ncbi:hypothetical protein JQC92_06700 [Shewanella sp. 202IG2-18]|uniref:hypothetical protein n=1 Tax=Parashewanella hymeniacidonis TaxID=2807618 RepID=UPI001961BED1|nr:hypothetical protein [Parashewanella hymeniacidonis]MBM7071731.1 hypothetical protein [Parashewanella hymeniacidonis]
MAATYPIEVVEDMIECKMAWARHGRRAKLWGTGCTIRAVRNLFNHIRNAQLRLGGMG